MDANTPAGRPDRPDTGLRTKAVEVLMSWPKTDVNTSTAKAKAR
jgi:hypothetical protein